MHLRTTLSTILAVAALLPSAALAANPWEKIDHMPMGNIPFIINYQITANGARIFGVLQEADKLEIADGPSILGEARALVNGTFELKLAQPLDPTKDHTLSVKAWDIGGKQMEIASIAAAPDKKSVAVTLTTQELQQQQTSLETLQAGGTAPSITPPASSVVASSIPGTASGEVAPSSSVLIWVIVFVVAFALLVAMYFLWKKRMKR